MATHVALLRGINVGGRNKVPMAELREVVFLNAGLPPGVLERIKAAETASAAKASRDTVTAIGPAVFLHTPDGYGTSELAQVLFRIIGTPGKTGIAATARNWATSTKLLSLCEEK